MIRLLTFIFTLNAIFFSMDGVCLCDMKNDSDHAMIQSSMSDLDESQETVDSNNCCNTSVCTDNCMGNLPYLSSYKQSMFISNTAEYPLKVHTHFYQLYLSVSSPPPLV